jgi:hypothetical protein
MLDSILKQALGGGQSGALGGLMDLVTKNPQILAAVAGLLSTRDTSVGGSGVPDGLGLRGGVAASPRPGAAGGAA